MKYVAIKADPKTFEVHEVRSDLGNKDTVNILKNAIKDLERQNGT